MLSVHRSQQNPLITPHTSHPWEAYATFNCSPVETDTATVLLYRALSHPEKFESTSFTMSTIGKAVLSARGTVTRRELFLEPEEAWERYGCEDPRVTRLGKKYYTFYTALGAFPFHAEHIRVAVAISKDLKKVDERHLVTPFNAKAMSLFPEKINGKYTVIFAAHTDQPPAKICIAQFDREEDMWSETAWNKWHEKIDQNTVQIPHADSDHIEVGAAPVSTPYGWLLVYSHIKDYFSDHKIFGIQAVLLDKKDPRIILAKTRGAFLTPQTWYEKEGVVRDITFPSGALLTGQKDKKLHIYYGGADTVCATATMSLDALVASMEFMDEGRRPLPIKAYRKSHRFHRPISAPIMLPIPVVPAAAGKPADPKSTVHEWESRAVFNPTAFDAVGTVHILYRAMSGDNTSTVGYATSDDALTISSRNDRPIYVPRVDAEAKRVPGGNSGCEDPRVTIFNNQVYLTYTGYNGVEAPCVMLSSISMKDFLNKKWEKWTLPIKVSKDGVDDKDGALFPAKIKGKYALIHRVEHQVCLSYSPTLDFKNRNEFVQHSILEPRPGMWDSLKVGLAMTPFLTKRGWVMMYHGISDDGKYSLGAALLDKENPENVLGRTEYPIFEPETPYELNGQVGRVVFPCGAVVRGDTVYIYYGGGDSVVGVATISLARLLDTLT